MVVAQTFGGKCNARNQGIYRSVGGVHWAQYLR